MVMLGSETAFMMRTASKELAEAKGSIVEPGESTGYWQELAFDCIAS